MPLRWAIRGCGAISTDFVNALKQLSPSEHSITAVCARKKESAESFQNRLQLTNAQAYAADDQSFLINPSIDVVYVGTLNHQHAACVLAALNAGKHVLCEKPLGVNATEVRAMVECAKKNKRFLMEGYWSRCFPVWRAMRALIDEGRIGSVQYVQSNFTYHYIENAAKFVADFGGGTTLSIGCYTYAFAQFVFREKWKSIQAIGHVNETAVNVDYGSGRFASCQYSAAASAPCEGVIVGSEGVLKIPARFWAPEQLNVYRRVGRETELTDHLKFELPKPSDTSITFKHLNAIGFVYEAEVVRECITKGELEWKDMSWQQSIELAEMNDEILKQLHIE